LAEEIARKKKIRSHFPTIEEITQLSRGGETYAWVCATFMKCVVGCNKWSRRYFKELISQIATESDESFMLLTLENNYNRWIKEANFVPTEEGEKPKLPSALYTNSGCSKVKGKGSSRRFHGWSKQGYHRFNVLYKMVRDDRRQRSQFEFELKTVFENNQKSDQVEEDDYELDEEEMWCANDCINVKQPILLNKKVQEQQDKSDDSEDDNDEEYSD
jgi:hypothetical protein